MMIMQIFEFVNSHNYFKLFFALLKFTLLKLILFLPLIIGYQ